MQHFKDENWDGTGTSTGLSFRSELNFKSENVTENRDWNEMT